MKRLFLAAFLLAVVSFPSPGGEDASLVLRFIDVGCGDAILIEYPPGFYSLVDTGPPAAREKLLGCLREQGVEKLLYLIVTHPHSDHLGNAVAAAESFEPRFLRDNGQAIAITLVTLVVSFFTLIFGELTPKNIALKHSQFITLLAARPRRLIIRRHPENIPLVDEYHPVAPAFEGGLKDHNEGVFHLGEHLAHPLNHVLVVMQVDLSLHQGAVHQLDDDLSGLHWPTEIFFRHCPSTY